MNERKKKKQKNSEEVELKKLTKMDNSTSLIDDKTCALGATRGQHFFFDLILCVSCFQ